MPKPSKERIDKAAAACLEAVRILQRHPKFDECRTQEDLSTRTRQDHHTTVTADIRFLKDGREIFRNPPELEDHDWPNLVGRKILDKAAREAAKKAKLKIGGNVRIYIAPSEKGWVEVGYQFWHHPPPPGY